MLYRRPQTDMAGEPLTNITSLVILLSNIDNSCCVCIYIMCVLVSDCAEKLFDLVDSFAESAKRKAAVWPLQIILLILCPNIIQELSREPLEESKVNKVHTHTLCHSKNKVATIFFTS